MRENPSILRKILPHILLCGSILMCHTLWAQGVVGVGQNGGELATNSIIRPIGTDFVTTVRATAITLLRAIKIALNGVALLALLYVGFLWVTSMGDEEQQSKGKNKIVLILLGLFLINVPEVIYRIFTGSSYLNDDFARKVGTVSNRDPGGGFNESALDQCNYFFCPQNFWGNGSTVAIVKFFEMLMIAVAVVMFTWGGFLMLFRGNNESTSQTAKNRIIYGMIALVVVGFMETIYRAIFFGGALSTRGLISTLVSVANFALFLAGPIAIIYIIVGAYFYITSAGDEERADRGKKILLYTFFATILLLLSYTFLVELVGLNI